MATAGICLGNLAVRWKANRLPFLNRSGASCTALLLDSIAAEKDGVDRDTEGRQKSTGVADEKYEV